MKIQDYYLAVGPYENWKKGFGGGCIWGLPENRVSTWNRLSAGDFVFFYVEIPVSAITGYGKIVGTAYDEAPFFADDYGKVSKWPYRFKFDVLWPKSDPLNSRRISIADLEITLHRGFQRLGLLKWRQIMDRCQD